MRKHYAIKKLISLLIVCLTSLPSFGQNSTVSGTVKDERGEAMPYVDARKSSVERTSINADANISGASGDNWEYSPLFSTDLVHQEYIPAAYVMFSSKEGTRFSYKAGIRTEYSIVKLLSDKEHLDKATGDFFLSPSLSGTFHISRKQDLSLAFSRRISYNFNSFKQQKNAQKKEEDRSRLKLGL